MDAAGLQRGRLTGLVLRGEDLVDVGQVAEQISLDGACESRLISWARTGRCAKAFVGSTVNFSDARFLGGTVNFSGTASGGMVDFTGAAGVALSGIRALGGGPGVAVPPAWM
jgi:hypothetical protein